MIYVVLPLGASTGWGICGKYVVRELSAQEPVRLITEPFSAVTLGDELEYEQLRRLTLPPDEQAALLANGKIDARVLSAIAGNQMISINPNVRGRFNVGYTFFEDNIIPAAYIQNAHRNFDVVTTGSSWNTDLLKRYGLKNVVTVIQGVDPQVFNPSNNEKEFLRDRFVIFSGGKFEFRKGQDLVIRACKIMQDKYKDVWLVNSWFNPWEFSFTTMSASPYIRFNPTVKDYVGMIQQILADNGVDVNRVITLLPRVNATLARIYKNSDVGLFPNRAEGGTNLVMMEYMACGKPVIASWTTGHKDIVTPDNALLVAPLKMLTMHRGGDRVAEWEDPNLDQIVAHLETAYHNRDKLKQLGDRAGADLSRFTWKATANSFLNVLNNH